MIWVKNAKYVRDHVIEITFGDHSKFLVDLYGHLQGEIFKPLKESTYFSKFRVDPDLDTIIWENGADFAPEFLYELGKAQLKKTA